MCAAIVVTSTGWTPRAGFLPMTSAFDDFRRWASQVFEVSPELAIGLIVVGIAPLLALIGWLVMSRTGSAVPARAGAGEADLTVGVLRRADQPSSPYRVGEGGLLLGGGADADVVLDGPGISEYHARIAKDGRAYFLIRLASDEDVAIYVDNKVVLQQPLDGGETIRIGGHVLTFELACPALDQLPLQAKRPAFGPKNGQIRTGGRRWQGAVIEATVDILARSSGR